MKPLWDLDDPMNLQEFIGIELKNLGIKVPRTKKLKNQDPPVNDKVFGNYLCYLPCVPVEQCGHVPRFLVSAVEVIEQFIDTEGLFRKSGAVSRQKELKQQIEDDQDFSDAHVFDVTGVVKQFFRELPDPLLTNKYHDTFVKCYQLSDKNKVASTILDLCLLLPGEHLGTLRYMMKFLARVADNSVVNKMDATNLAVVLGPNIMHVNMNKTEKMNSCEEKLLQTQTAIVEILIRNADQVGIVSNSLLERLDLLESLKIEDNSSEIKMEGTAEESSKSKKKKKRRSSSLQGFVSNIAQSLSKWRATPGKSNVSQLSGGSESSNENIPSAFPTTLPIITPKVMRKRKASGEAIAFSATKKKAILMNMPSTQFTPASMNKKLPPEIEKALEKGTPSINFAKSDKMEFTATPTKKKTPRKRLSLFSPSSARKSKSWSVTSSSSNIKPASPVKEKKKGLFRRLSGGKSKADSPSSGKQPLHDLVGERLASPARGVTASDSNSKINKKSSKQKKQAIPPRESPISALINVIPLVQLNSPPMSVDSPSYRFQSPSKLEDPRKVLTHQHISAPCRLVDQSVVCGGRERPNVKLHRRAKSADVKRGKPNTVANGLNSKEVSLPLKVKHQSLRRKCSRSRSMHSSSRRHLVIENPYTSRGKLNRSRTMHGESDKSMNRSTVTADFLIDPPEEFADKQLEPVDNEGSDSDQSEAGFSTISGDTVIFVPAAKLSVSKECGDESITRAVEKLEKEDRKAQSVQNPRPEPEGGNPCGKDSHSAIRSQKSSRKYPSMDDLKKPCNKGQSVARSHSLYDTSSKKHHAVPNLMVSSDMRNMLSRAGYVKEMERVKEEATPEVQKECAEKTTEIIEEEMAPVERAEITEEEMAPIRRATVNVNRHESVLELGNSGKVTNNIRKFSESKQENCELAVRHTSPLRFPRSTTRTRGASPVRIPTIFAKKDPDAERFRQIAITALKGAGRASKRGTANLPISTKLLRPSVEATQCSESTSKEADSHFTRKPSIYKVRPDAYPHVTKLRLKDGLSSDSINISKQQCRPKLSTLDGDITDSPSTVLNSRILEMTVADDDVFNVTPHPAGDFTRPADGDMSSVDLSSINVGKTLDLDLLAVERVPLNNSLQETINQVCTPLSEKLLKNSDRLPKTPLRESNSANVKDNQPISTPHIRQALVKHNRGSLRLRTAAGMTPRHILVANRSPGSRVHSPVKPLKRLSSPSPHRKSPRRLAIRGKHTNLADGPALSALPSYMQDELGAQL